MTVYFSLAVLEYAEIFTVTRDIILLRNIILERKKTVKKVSKSGVGAEREKGVKNAKNGRKGYPNHSDQNSSHAIKRGKGR